MAGNSRSGARPKPTALKILEGTLRADRQTHDEPEVVPFNETPPNWLDQQARKEWDRLVPILVKLGVLSETDRTAVIVYCAAWSRFATAAMLFKVNGPVMISSKSGDEVRSPYGAEMSSALVDLKAFLVEFGLTPSSRSRISAMPGSERALDPLEQFLAGGGS